MPECFDIDPSGGDVRCHQHRKLAALESRESRRALKL
jgi:hypothetical protein